MGGTSPRRLAAALGVALWLGGLAFVLAAYARTPLAQTVGDLSNLAASLVACVGCAVAARRGGERRRAWSLLSVGVGVWVAAQATWTFYGITRAHDYPFPSLADIGFLGYALPVAAGLLMFPRSSIRRSSRLQVVLDAAVIAAAVLFLSWVTVLGPVYQSGGSGLTRAVGLAFPVVDVALASVVLALGVRVPSGLRLPWVLLGGGFVLLAFTDSSYVSQQLAGQPGSTGSLLTLGWTGAFLLVAAASQVREGARREGGARHSTVVQELLPLAPFLAVACVLGLGAVGSEGTFLLANGLLLLALFAAQQITLAVEKVRLANSLEATIEERTAELRSADGRFRSLVESSADAIVGKSLDGVITSWNPAAERLMGYSAEEIIGQSVELVIPPHRMGEELELRALVRAGERVEQSYDTERLHRDGTIVPVALTVSPIYDGDTLLGISAILRDVTEVRRREEELTQTRTAAVEASRAKSEFLATMSHEIRTPMNGVIGLTGLLLDTELDEVQRRYATGVRGAGEALLGIIDDILDFSKLEAGKVELEDVELDPREIVEEVGVLLAAAAAEKGLELIAHCDPSVPGCLRGDPGRLRQVLINLTGNAVKFTSSGEVVLRVHVDAEAPAKEGLAALRFEVTDTGVGIAPEDQERLFEPFSQADASTTRRFGGTGLGLAICVRLVEAMGGEMGVESRLRRGSTFHFTLELPVAPSRSRPGPRLLPARLRALVVDDNATNRLVLVTQLTAWGLLPAEVSGGAAALTELRRAAAEGTPYDVVLLDMMMPEMDGLDVAAEMEASPGLTGVSRMILTSGGVADQQRAAAAGVTEWVSKPVRVSELYDALARLTAQPLSTRAAGADTTQPLPRPQGGPVRGRILVAEDNLVNQMVAEGVLSSLGYLVELAGNGRDALAALEAESYDVVFMDCHMPVMDGFEATRELRRREGALRHTPVVAMTAGVLPEDRERCVEAGMDDFVAKPIDVGALERTLMFWMKEAGTFEHTPGLAPATAPVHSVLTSSRLDVLRGMGGEPGWGILPKVAAAFIATAPEQLAAVRAAALAGDATALARTAHSLRGAAANLGADSVARACTALEQAGDVDESTSALVDELDAVLTAASTELALILAQRS